MPSTEVASPVEHKTQVFDMPSGLWQAQCACAWKGEETTQKIAKRQAGDHLLKPDGLSAEVVAAINYYGADEADRATKRHGSRQVNPTDTAVMKLRSAGYARYEAGDTTAAAILYREAAIQIAQELESISGGLTAVEAAVVTPMIVKEPKPVSQLPLPTPPKGRIPHRAHPGPMYWDFRCLRCSQPVDDHMNLLELLWHRLRRRHEAT